MGILNAVGITCPRLRVVILSDDKTLAEETVANKFRSTGRTAETEPEETASSHFWKLVTDDLRLASFQLWRFDVW